MLAANCVHILVLQMYWAGLGRDLLGDFGVELVGAADELWHGHELVARWSLGGVHGEHDLDHLRQVPAILFRQLLVLALKDTHAQALHIVCVKWRLQGNHFVDDTTQ